MSFHKLNSEIGNKILDKFGHKCINCDSTNDLCIHHIQPLPVNHPNYNDEHNLTVLCRSCHKKHHRISGEIYRPISKFGKGITFNPRGRKFKLHLNQKHIGYFDTLEEAEKAKELYLKAN